MPLLRATATPTISTTEYAVGDAIGGQMEFNVGANRGLIQACRVLDKARQWSPLQLWLFRASTTGAGLSDNTPFAPTDAQMEHFAGAVRIDDWFLAGDNSIGQANNLRQSFADLTGGILYGWLVSGGTPGYLSTSDLTVHLETDQAASTINRRQRVYYSRGVKPRPPRSAGYAVGAQLELNVGVSTGSIVGCRVLDKSGQREPLELWLYSAPTTSLHLVSNEPFAPTNAEQANLIGVLRISDWFAAAANSVGQAENPSLQFGGLTGATLYGWLVTRGAATYVTADLSVALDVRKAASSINRRARTYYYLRPNWRSQLRTLFGGSYTHKSDFTAFVERFQRIIADPGSLQPEAFDFLDRCGWNAKSGDGKLDYSDLLFWLNALLKEQLPTLPRLPISGNGWSATPADSDPLGLRAKTPSGTQVIIIDPQNPDAVIVRRGRNDCFEQDNMTSAGNLWDGGATPGNTYEQALWYSLNSLDESNWGASDATSVTGIRRFPKSASQQVVIFVRGGNHILDKEIEIKKLNANWERPDRIHILGYPGESPTVHCGSSLIELNEPGETYAGFYRLVPVVTCERHALLMENIEWVGHRDSGNDRIFAHHLIRFAVTDSGPTPPHIRNCVFRDSRGFDPNESTPSPATYPGWVDDKFNDRYRWSQPLYRTDLATSGASSTTLTSATGGFTAGMDEMYIRITAGTNFVPGLYRVTAFNSSNSVTLASSPTPSGAGSGGSGRMGAVNPAFGVTGALTVIATVTIAAVNARVHHCLVQPVAPDGPLSPDTYNSEGLDINAAGVTVEYCTLRGHSEHGMLRATGANSTIRYNDVSNLDHTGLGSSVNGFNISYNRIHGYGQGHVQPHAGIQCGGDAAVTTGTIRGNVIWNTSSDGAPEFGIWLSTDAGGVYISGVTVEGNILYNCALALIHNSGDVPATSDIHDNNVRGNIIVELPTYNAGVTAWNAPVVFNVGQNPVANNAAGNTLQNNIIRRDSGTAALRVWEGSGVYTPYAVGDTFPGMSGNVTTDPQFRDPDNGDFRLLAASPATNYLSPEVPLAALPPWNLNPLNGIR